MRIGRFMGGEEVVVRRGGRAASLQALVAHCTEYGFVFPSSEIYGGFAGVYDYGPMGAPLKRNVKEYWWRAMVQLHANIVGLDSAILMHPKVWEASGHTAHFFDWFVENRKNRKRYRVDQVVEAWVDRLRAEGREGEARRVWEAFEEALRSGRSEELTAFFRAYRVEDPEEGAPGDWGAVRRLNLMFVTWAGATDEDRQEVYLRPETAQGIYVNYLHVQRSARLRVPFGIAQVGKAFRNELIFRQFLMRMREFEQMEMQFFVAPEESEEWFDRWIDRRLRWYLALGFDRSRLRVQPHKHLAHYAQKAVDIEYRFPMGWKEVEGIHLRTDYDLRRHQEFSRKKLTYFDPFKQEHYLPHIVETSAGVDRVFLAILSEFLVWEQLDEGSGGGERVVFRCPRWLAPVQVAVFPLVRRDGLPEVARRIFDALSLHFVCAYEEKDSIGRRYRRHDAIGTPYAVTVDYQTLEDETVTLRDRDTLRQERIAIPDLIVRLKELLDWSELLRRVRES